jgi:hypothetical protein
MGRFQVERSSRVREAGGVGCENVLVGEVRRVVVMKEAIWGQTRGWRDEQRIIAIDGIVGVAILRYRRGGGSK